MKFKIHKGSPREEAVELRHVETLLDVVFGVVVALPLLEVPAKVQAFLSTGTPASAVSPLLLISALIFTVFYWLEVRHFIAAQEAFNAAIAKSPESSYESVPLSQAAFVLGGLFMMGLAAAALVFAKDDHYRAFLVANIAFWLSDLTGTFVLKRTYLPFSRAIAKAKTDHWVEFRWFWGHIGSPYFFFYGAGNATFFITGLATDAFTSHPYVRCAYGVVLLLFTPFRHLFWRSSWYVGWLEARHSKQS